MKKALSMILVLTMVLALALPAMAAETIEPSDGASSTDVKATYKAPQDKISGNVYTATIVWKAAEVTDGPLTFTGATTAYVWNPALMKYEQKDNVKGTSVAAKWTGSAGYVVTVTNKSNAEIGYKVTATNTYNLTLTGNDADEAPATAIPNPVSGITNEKVAGTEKGAANGEAADTKTVTYTAIDSASTNVSLTNQELVVGKITVTITHN